MTATDELRRLLDERRMEYKDRNVFGKHVFHWGKPFHGAMFTDAGEWTELVVENASPEQAVEATLGRGTCEADETDTIKCWVKCKDKPSTEHMHLIHVMECSACGGTYEHVNGGYEFCPRCGRKVVGA